LRYQIVHNFFTYFLYFSAKFVLIIAIISIIILINRIDIIILNIAKSASINVAIVTLPTIGISIVSFFD